MKKIFFGLFLCSCLTSQSQEIAKQKSAAIAHSMRDSLSLSEPQTEQIFLINMQLHIKKASVFKQYSGNDSLVKSKIQILENTRDSLFRPVLSQNQYEFYLRRKQVFLAAN